MSKIILIGAGAFARDMIDAFGRDTFVGIYVDPDFPTGSLSGLPVFTRWTDVREAASYYVLGVSDIDHRERARGAASKAGLAPAPPLVSRTAIAAADARLASGCAVGHMAVIGPSARLGEDTLVMHSCVIAHDSVIGDNTVLAAGVCTGGHVQIGPRTFIGSNAVLAPKVKIGAGCYIAAGAACFRDAEPGTRWIGNPARRADR
jgi:sugar O-acyltransferase (sialic acid O-acetyltransferase NeuD family)